MGKRRTQRSQADSYKALAAAAIKKAVKDIGSEDAGAGCDALIWLGSDAAQPFLEIVGVELSPSDVLAEVVKKSEVSMNVRNELQSKANGIRQSLSEKAGARRALNGEINALVGSILDAPTPDEHQALDEFELLSAETDVLQNRLLAAESALRRLGLVDDVFTPPVSSFYGGMT